MAAFGDRAGGSSGHQETLGQEVNPGTAIHLTLDHLQPVDLTLGWAVAPWQRDRGAHCVVVGQQAFGKAAQRRDRTVLRAAQPRVKALGRAVPNPSSAVGMGISEC